MAKTEDTQMLVPDKQATIEEIISQESPGKESDKAAEALLAQLQAMSNEDLLALLEQAYQEDSVANSLVIQKTTQLLTERGAGEQAEKKIQEVRSQDWRSLLGEFIGGELYDLVSDQVELKDLEGYGHKALDGALGALSGTLGDLELDNAAQLEKFAEALAESALKAGDEWLASESGQKLLAGVSRWVDENPAYVLLGVILAAAGAIAADMPIPELKTKLNIAEGLTAEVSAKLGSLRNIALEAAKVDLQYVTGQFKAKAGVEKDEKGYSGSAELRYGSDEDYIQTTGQIDPEGNIIVGLDAAFKEGLFSGGAKAGHDFSTGDTNADLQLRFGTDEDFVSLGSSFLDNGDGIQFDANAVLRQRFGDENNNLNLGADLGYNQEGDLSQKYNLGYRFGNENQYNFGSAGYDNGQANLTTGNRTNFEGGNFTDQYVSSGMLGGEMSTYRQQLFNYNPNDRLKLGIDQRDNDLDGNFETVAAEFGLTIPQLAAVVAKYGRDQDGKQTGEVSVSHDGENLDAQLGLKYDGENTVANGSVSYEKDNWEAALLTEVNLTTGELQKLSGKLGFRDPEEFRAFSVDFSHQVEGGIPTTHLGAMFEAQLGAYMIRGTANASFSPEGNAYDGSLMGARQLNTDWALIGGVSAGRDAMGGTSLTPQVGVQYKNIPITVGWDIGNNGSNGFRIGVTIPFGR